ncbi:uncharacterized protein BDR25DRAFT_300823, partial [Lindgomyces ingoldianus]
MHDNGTVVGLYPGLWCFSGSSLSIVFRLYRTDSNRLFNLFSPVSFRRLHHSQTNRCRRTSALIF